MAKRGQRSWYERSSPRQLFLLDAAGAALSASLLGGPLATFESFFGMPPAVLYPLSIVAGILAFYSYACHRLVGANWRPYLAGVAIANLLYCLVTLGLVLRHWPGLTGFGVAYFLLEIGIIVALVTIELRAVRR